jgi:SAM-dependent methyltransferase
MIARSRDHALLDSSNDMSDDIFRQYGAYYDLLYRDKDYASEARYVVRTLRAADPQVRTVLEFGSGTGRHGRLLAERGLDVFGVERSDAMVAVARRPQASSLTEGGGRFECVQGDIRTADIGRSFDAVISLFHVVSYQTRATAGGLPLRCLARSGRSEPAPGSPGEACRR